MKRILPAAALLAILLCRCDDNTFSPKAAGYTPRLVVYAILDAARPAQQLVRIETTYDSPTVNPQDGPGPGRVDSASMYVNGSVSTISYRDTTVVDSAGGSHKLWVGNAGRFVEGGTYTLHLSARGFPPFQTSLQFPTHPYLYNRLIVTPGATAQLELGTSPQGEKSGVKGYLFRLFFVGTKIINGQEVEIRREVPYLVANENGVQKVEYPGVTRQSSIRFSVLNIQQVYTEMDARLLVQNIKPVAIGYSFEQNLYNYYYAVRGFNDPLSIRQDAPDFSNIPGGFGVFGAMNTDTLTMRLIDVIGQ